MYIMNSDIKALCVVVTQCLLRILITLIAYQLTPAKGNVDLLQVHSMYSTSIVAIADFYTDTTIYWYCAKLACMVVYFPEHHVCALCELYKGPSC